MSSIISAFGNPIELVGILISIPIALIALSFHEAAHAFIADKLGDPTARNLGRVTMNPAKHLDLIGTLCMIFAGFGWANPVPVNSRNFSKPKRDMALTAVAGPVANFLLFLIGVLVYALFNECVVRFDLVTESNYYFFWVLYSFLASFYYYNLCLAIFNFIPIPPFDGSRLAFIFLPDKVYFGVMKYERYIMLGLMVLLISGAVDLPIGFIANGICSGFEYLLKLIPFFSNLQL